MSEQIDKRAAALFDGDYEVEEQIDVQTKLDGPDHCCIYCQQEFDNRTDLDRHVCQGKLEANLVGVGAPAFIEPAVHESEWKLTFETGSMAAYGQVRNGFDAALNNRVNSFDVDGETWKIITSETVENDERLDEDATGNDAPAVVRNWKGGIRAEDEEEYDKYAEYSIPVRSDEDEVGERKITFQFKPSLPNPIHHESGEPIKSLPTGLPKGVRVELNSANVHPDEYLPVLQGLADALGIYSKYYREEKLVQGRGSQLALYVRANRNALKPLVKDDGVFERLARLMNSKADASGKLSWDNTGVEGKRQAVEDIHSTWNKILPGQTLGKRLKHYHREHPTVQATDSPTSSPKVEVQFSPKLNENYITWEDRHESINDLEEALLNALHWADVRIAGDDDALKAVYRDDDPYFDITTSQRDITITEDPTHELLGAEQDLAEAQFRDANLTEKRQDILEYVLTGGRQHYKDLADQADASVRTVYRTLETLGGLLDSDDGMVDFVDRAVRERIEQYFATVHELAEHTVSDVYDIVEVQEAAEFKDNVFGQWMQAHGAEVLGEANDRGWEIDLGSIKRGYFDVKRILRAGLVAAKAIHKASEYYRSYVTYVDSNGEQQSLAVEEMVNGHSLADALEATVQRA